MDIKKIKLFPNPKSLGVGEILKDKLLGAGYLIVDEDYDLAIAIGGDGSYLHMVRNNQFNSDIYYIGVNNGTLGFLQDIQVNELDSFVENLNKGLYRVDPIGIQETKVLTKLGEMHFYSLNEIVIRRMDFKRADFLVYVDEELLQHYSGDGLLVATTVGSTAYNLSLGGSIIYNGFHTLQLTPIAPLNTSVYRSLQNSIVFPENRLIQIVPEEDTRDLMVSIDGKNYFYQDVEEVQTTVSKKKIKSLRMNQYSYPEIIRDKFLK